MSADSAENEIIGDWKSFHFKMISKEDHTKVLEHLRKCLYFPAFEVMGYTKDLDDEMEAIFTQVLNSEDKLSFIAVDKATGKIAACRIITMDKAANMNKDYFNDPSLPYKSRMVKGIINFYYSIFKEGDPFKRYGLNEMPHMFGVSVDSEFGQQGLATEIYRRATAFLKAKGYAVAGVGFISPFSRAAANHNGFIQLAKRSIDKAKDGEGNPLCENPDPNWIMDIGVFEL